MTSIRAPSSFDRQTPTEPHYTSAPADGHVPAADLWRIVNSSRLTILGTAMALALLTLAYCMLTPWLYSASTQILIDPRDKSIMANDVNPSALGPDGGVAQVESQVTVVSSSGVLLRAIAAEHLGDDPDFVSTGLVQRLVRTIDGVLGIAKPADADPQADKNEQALRSLRKRLSVKRADKVFVIDVTVTLRDAAKAARVVNAIADAYLADQAAARSNAGERASTALEARLSEQKAKVDAAEQAIQRYKAAHAMVDANGVLVEDQQLTDSSSGLAAARTHTAELRSRLDQIEEARHHGLAGDGTAEALGSTVVTQLRARSAELTQKEADLRTQLGPRHPAIASVQSQIGDVKRLIGAELDRIVRAARADYDRAKVNEAALSTRLDRKTADSLATRQAAVHLRELERDLQADQTVYSNFLLRAQETREQASIDTTNARVITRATPPSEHSWPPTGILVAAAFAGGLGLAVAGVLLMAAVRPTILSPDHLQDLSGLPVFRVASRRPSRKGRDEALDPLLRSVMAPGERMGGSTILGVLVAGGSTSGAITARLSERLAAAADAVGERVLLVRSDTSAHTKHRVAGLRDVLRGDVPLAKALGRQNGSGIAVLEAGRERSDSADWKQTRSASWFLAQAAREFDLVVVDGGAPSLAARTPSLFADCERVVVAAEAGVTPQSEVTDVIDRLRGMGARPTMAALVDRGARV